MLKPSKLILFKKHSTSIQFLPRLSFSNLTRELVVLIFQNAISLTLIISCVFLRVVWTLYEPVLAVSDISPTVSERILSRHELVSDKRSSCSQTTGYIILYYIYSSENVWGWVWHYKEFWELLGKIRISWKNIQPV